MDGDETGRINAEVREVLDDVLAAGLRPEAVRGASQTQIVEVAAAQGVSVVPLAVRLVWSLIGAAPGPFWMGSVREVTDLGPERKALARESLDDHEHPLGDPDGMLVLLAHESTEFHVIDGADLEQANPPVWRLYEGEPPHRLWPTVVDWFRFAATNVMELKRSLDELVREGGESTLSEYFN